MDVSNQFQFSHFSKCAEKIEEYLEEKNSSKLLKVLEIITKVWKRQADQDIEITVFCSGVIVTIDIFTKVAESHPESKVMDEIWDCCTCILMIFKGSEARFPDFPSADQAKALENVLLKLCDMIHILKQLNQKLFMFTILAIQKSAIQHAALYLDPCDFKKKLVGIFCDTVEEQAANLLEHASTDALKQTTFYIKLLTEFAAAYQNDHFDTSDIVVDLIFWLLKIENTDTIEKDLTDLLHHSITIGLMGLLKHLYAGQAFCKKILNLPMDEDNEVRSVYIIYSELIKLLLKDSGANLDLYFNLSHPYLFEKLFEVVLKLESFFTDDRKEIEAVGQLTICVMLASKSGFYKKIDRFLLEKLTDTDTNGDLKTLYLTMTCYQSIARICNSTSSLIYFKKFLRMYRGLTPDSPKLAVLKILCKTFFICLPKKDKLQYCEQNCVINRPMKWLILGTDKLDAAKTSQLEIETKRLMTEVPESAADYRRLLTFLLLLRDKTNLASPEKLEMVENLGRYPNLRKLQSFKEVLRSKPLTAKPINFSEFENQINNPPSSQNLTPSSQVLSQLEGFTPPQAVTTSDSFVFDVDWDEGIAEPEPKKSKVVPESTVNHLLDEVLRLVNSIPEDCDLTDGDRVKINEVMDRLKNLTH